MIVHKELRQTRRGQKRALGGAMWASIPRQAHAKPSRAMGGRNQIGAAFHMPDIDNKVQQRGDATMSPIHTRGEGASNWRGANEKGPPRTWEKANPG